MTAVGLLLSGAVFGAMAFFSFAVAPLAFRVLGEDRAGRFVGEVFPHYFLWLGLAAAIAALLLGLGNRDLAAQLMTVAAAILWGQRLFLLPRLDRLRDARTAGDAGAARAFARLHGISMMLNLLALLLAGAAVLAGA